MNNSISNSHTFKGSVTLKAILVCMCVFICLYMSEDVGAEENISGTQCVALLILFVCGFFCNGISLKLNSIFKFYSISKQKQSGSYNQGKYFSLIFQWDFFFLYLWRIRHSVLSHSELIGNCELYRQLAALLGWGINPFTRALHKQNNRNTENSQKQPYLEQDSNPRPQYLK